MLNCSYRLVAPRTIQPVLLQVDAADRVVVRPTNLSICNADQRYYQGVRSEEVLRKKLPMALIHEGIGRVVSDQTGEHNCGDLVVMIPNEPSKQDLVIAENYLSDSKFRGSGFDGFMQELVVLSPNRVIPLPRGIDADIAAFTELVSVAMHAIRRFMLTAHCRRRRVGIWGDGNVGYIVALLLHYLLPDTELFVVVATLRSWPISLLFQMFFWQAKCLSKHELIMLLNVAGERVLLLQLSRLSSISNLKGQCLFWVLSKIPCQ